MSETGTLMWPLAYYSFSPHRCKQH